MFFLDIMFLLWYPNKKLTGCINPYNRFNKLLDFQILGEKEGEPAKKGFNFRLGKL